MTVTETNNIVEFGVAVPPAGQHSVTTHIPGWESATKIRDGDQVLFSRLKNMYPRFAPWGVNREMFGALHKRLALPPTHMCIAFPSPDAFEMARHYAMSPHRGEQLKIVDESELIFKIVDVALPSPSATTSTIRLYVVGGPMAKAKSLMAVWQIPGTGMSTRLSELLLPQVLASALVEAEVSPAASPSEEKEKAKTKDGGLPMSPAHSALKERIVSLLQRAPLDPARAALLQPERDVFLYPSGMAAIYRAHCALTVAHPERAVLVLGSIFKSTWQLFEDHAGGMKHFGDCSAASGVVARVEEWLEGEKAADREISYLFVEFPSNPILVAADLFGLRKLADRYAFPIVVDDTIGGFANIDLLPVADVIVSSLTKSFSGYADVMAGSAVVNPAYNNNNNNNLAATFASQFRNEFFEADAEKLLANNEDYLARTIILNRNAAALASRIASSLQFSPSTPDVYVNGNNGHAHVHTNGNSTANKSPSPVIKVNYPLQNDTLSHYTSLLRPATPDFTPGHGCLLSIDFATMEQAVAFYDGCAFFATPHLGAHRTLAMPFSEIAWGCSKPSKDSEYHASYGVRGPQVRISAGLEDEEVLLGLLEDALAKARAV